MKQYALRFSVFGLILALVVLAACALTRPARPVGGPAGAAPAQENTISQVKRGAIAIDGDLADWEAREWVAVCTTLAGTQQAPSPSLDVRASFAFDADRLYLAVRALDDVLETADRSWRYGDGFLFTLVTDEGKAASSYVYQFGFDGMGRFLVFRNGEFFPPYDTRTVEYEFRQRDHGVDYEIAIPLTLLRPFNPFTYEQAALNLIYADKDGAIVNRVMIHRDSGYDTEATNERAGRFFAFKTASPESAQDASYHVSLKKNFYQDGEAIALRYAVNADKAQGSARLRVALFNEGTEKRQAETTLDLRPGLNRGSFPLEIGGLATGNYGFRVTFEDRDGKQVSEYTDDLFVLNRAELEAARSGIPAFGAREDLRDSLPNLEIRFEWLEQFYQRPNYEDISPLNGWWDDVRYLTSRLEQGEPAVFGNNTIKRYAHRSEIDGTLQPYSAYLPDDFNADAEYPLIVVLHGSGVDEQGFFSGVVQIGGPLGYPLIAPKARGLSDWYRGSSGEDVFECIDHFISLYPNIRRDRIFLMGFSMGGYGTWHLGILRPDYFRGLIVVSGAVRLDVLEEIDAIREQNIFVVHGAKDPAVPVADARAVVAKLEALQANVVYIEVPEGGHGDFKDNEPLMELLAWVKQYAE